MKPTEKSFTIEKPDPELTEKEKEKIAKTLLKNDNRKIFKSGYNFWKDTLGEKDYKKLLKGLKNNSLTIEVSYVIDESLNKIKQNAEKLFCPYCGHKKSFVVETDINSGTVCKNILCKRFNHND